ncbi:calcium uniporter protein, mitochondrial-like [Ruditapes philippinarum]|uniref:calcium uniporter protein, mitochondrial-like n=1 Tax=Ruditapes philippinarum TaxID=129788 RepID=UPI00295B1429|nr:calcium uniporter protein, mitochondrial-like [Ruditapes philippinarum]
MATSGVSWVVRQTLNRFAHPNKSHLLVGKAQKLSHINAAVCPCLSYCTTVLSRDNVLVEYRHGLSVFSVPLPSRKESCEFVLKPVSHTVQDLVSFLKEEDKGIDRVAVYRDNGAKIAGSTTIDILLRSPFTVTINENSYTISPPEPEMTLPTESFEKLTEVKALTAKLFSQLNVEEYQLKREKEIIQDLEEYRVQIAPLLLQKAEMEQKIVSRNTTAMYVGSTLMGLQFGFFARLTWWEYSWDVMEPVTYFATYAAIIGMYAYYTVCAQEYNYVDAWDREFINKFYKLARKEGFDIEEYNRLSNLIAQRESDLCRLRDPLQLHLPIREL